MEHAQSFCVQTADLIGRIDRAQSRVVLALPGLQEKVGTALLACHRRLPGRVLIVVDPDERVFRVGYGSFTEIKEVVGRGLPMLVRRGLRLGCALIDESAFFFTEPPLLVEAPPEPEVRAVNAAWVDPKTALAYLRSLANGPELDGVFAPHPDLAPGAQEDPLVRVALSQEAKSAPPAAIPITETEVDAIDKGLALAPPLDFQVHRQSMVYSSLLMYVDVELTACRFDNREIVVKKSLLPLLGETAELISRKAFQLEWSGDPTRLKEIQSRTDYLKNRIARSLGKPYGRVLLRSDLKKFEDERAAIEALIQEAQPDALGAFRNGLEPQIQSIVKICMAQCDQALSDEDIIQTLRPNPRDAWETRQWNDWLRSGRDRDELEGRLREKIEDAIRKDVSLVLRNLGFPKLEVLIREFTFQQMNHEEFARRLLKHFPDKQDLRPFLVDRAVIGKKASAPSHPDRSTPAAGERP